MNKNIYKFLMKDIFEGNIVIDESMVKNIQEYNFIKDEISCEICNKIVIMPKQCQSCETVFCEKCITEWKSKNNTCPKRCQNFIINDSPKLIKKLLDKINIECLYCKNVFNYDTYIYKHFSECYKKNRKIKCPFCSGCEVSYSKIEEYENKHLKEKEELLNDINRYKQKIKELENNQNKVQYKWATIQKKKNFELSKENKTIKIHYSSCYNLYFLDYIFDNSDNEYSIGISLNTFGKQLDYIQLGFINEYFTNYCLCQVPNNSFFIRVDNQTIYEGSKKKLTIDLLDKTKIILLFVLNLKTKQLNIKNYDTKKSYGIINVEGNYFRFLVSKCNPGDIEYTILP